jgi:hypothetical protein
MIIVRVCPECGQEFSTYGGRPEHLDPNPDVPRPDEQEAAMDAALERHLADHHPAPQP